MGDHISYQEPEKVGRVGPQDAKHQCALHLADAVGPWPAWGEAPPLLSPPIVLLLPIVETSRPTSHLCCSIPLPRGVLP